MIPFPDQRDDDPRNGGHTVFLVDSPCLNLDVVEWNLYLRQDTHSGDGVGDLAYLG